MKQSVFLKNDTRDSASERFAYIDLHGAGVPVDTRMPEAVSDWREILSDPSNSPTLTDHFYRKDTWEKFYSQHAASFRIALGENRREAVVLDIGCGDAFGLESWVNECNSYHGLDYSSDMLNTARRYLPREKYPHVTFYRGDASKSYFQSEFADFVISSEVIEHLDNPIGHIEDLKRLAKQGGFISLSTPCSSMYYYPSEVLPLIKTRAGRTYWRKATRCHEYWAEMLPHHPALSPKALRRMIESSGLNVVRHHSCVFFVQTRWQPSLRLSRYLERRKMRTHLPIIRGLHRLLEKLLECRLPYVRFMGTRQFVLARKP